MNNCKLEFTKKDLKSGMMVELRDGSRWVVLLNTIFDNVFMNVSNVSNVYIANGRNYIRFDDFYTDLTSTTKINHSDIIKVFTYFYGDTILDYGKYALLWERPEQVDFSTAFKAYCKKKVIKSVATRYKYSTLYGIGITIINATNEEIDSDWIILRGSETSD